MDINKRLLQALLDVSKSFESQLESEGRASEPLGVSAPQACRRHQLLGPSVECTGSSSTVKESTPWSLPTSAEGLSVWIPVQ